MLPPNTELLLRRIPKNNGIYLDALLIREPQSPIAPTIYMEDYYRLYQEGTVMEDICRIICDVYREVQLNHTIDPRFFTDYNQVREHLVYQLVNRRKNENRLPELPHIPYLDLAITFCCLIQMNSGETAGITIKNEHLKLWDIDLDTLKEQAFFNTPRLLPAYIQPISTAIRDLMEKNPQLDRLLPLAPDDMPPLYVMTNENQCGGAASILYPDLLSEFAEDLEQDLYVLPSSIHEVLLLPTDSRCADEELTRLVQSVNSEQLPLSQQLSDHVYYYSRAEKCLLQ
jgi:hypothetical protein